MKINFNKINYETDKNFKNEIEIIEYIKIILDYLETHNKNYTVEQMKKINNLISIFNNIE